MLRNRRWKMPKMRINWFEISLDFHLAYTIALAVSMCIAMMMIMLGFHNMDLGHNMGRLNMVWEEAFNETLVDRGIGAGKVKIFNQANLVQTGAQQIMNGVIGLMISGALFGSAATALRFKRRENVQFTTAKRKGS